MSNATIVLASDSAQTVPELGRLEKTAAAFERFMASELSLTLKEYRRVHSIFTNLVDGIQDFDVYRIYQAVFLIYLDRFADKLGKQNVDDKNMPEYVMVNSIITLGAYARRIREEEIKLDTVTVDRMKRALLIAFENRNPVVRDFTAQVLANLPSADVKTALQHYIDTRSLANKVARQAQITLCRMEIAELNHGETGSHLLTVYETLVSILRSDLCAVNGQTKLEDDLAILSTFLAVVRRKGHELPADVLKDLHATAERTLVYILMNAHINARSEAASALGFFEGQHVEIALKMTLGKYGVESEPGSTAATSLARIADRRAKATNTAGPMLPKPHVFNSPVTRVSPLQLHRITA